MATEQTPVINKNRNPKKMKVQVNTINSGWRVLCGMAAGGIVALGVYSVAEATNPKSNLSLAHVILLCMVSSGIGAGTYYGLGKLTRSNEDLPMLEGVSVPGYGGNQPLQLEVNLSPETQALLQGRPIQVHPNALPTAATLEAQFQVAQPTESVIPQAEDTVINLPNPNPQVNNGANVSVDDETEILLPAKNSADYSQWDN